MTVVSLFNQASDKKMAPALVFDYRERGLVHVYAVRMY